MLRAVAGFSSSTPLTPGQITAQGGIIVLGNQGVPMIVVGSGSMANNGALTLTTALAANPAITSAYVYLPAGAIASGVPAAATWYYAVFSSTTVATVYNNTYTSGTPVIPASPVAFSTTGPGAYTGISSQVTAYNISIPGGTIGLNGSLLCQVTLEYTNSAATKTVQATYGSYVFGSQNHSTTVNATWPFAFSNQGATNSQILTNAQGNFGTTPNAPSLGAVDSTTAQTLAVKLTNATPASNNFYLTQTSALLYPSVT